MEILESYNTLEAVPKEVAENYEKRDDGTYVLKFVKGLKGALDKERENVSGLVVKLKKTEDRLTTDITTAVTKREAELQEEFSQREAGIRKEAMDSSHSAKKTAAAATALQKAGGNILLLEDKVAAKLAVSEDGEVFVASDDGTPLLDAAGSAMTVDVLIESFRADPNFKGAFKGNGNSGGGGAGAENGSGVMNGGDTDVPAFRGQMTPKQKVAYINEHGDEQFQSLPL